MFPVKPWQFQKQAQTPWPERNPPICWLISTSWYALKQHAVSLFKISTVVLYYHVIKANLFNDIKGSRRHPYSLLLSDILQHVSHGWTRIHPVPGMCSCWFLRSLCSFLSSRSALRSPYPSQFSCGTTAHHSRLMAPFTERHTYSFHHQDTAHHSASLSSSARWTWATHAEEWRPGPLHSRPSM